MNALDLAPKASRRQNQAKVVMDYEPGESNTKFKAVLIKWRQQVHAEYWGGKLDYFLGPAALISNEIIKSICHLSHAHAIHTVDDISNNICRAQHPLVMKHAERIMSMVHSIIPP